MTQSVNNQLVEQLSAAPDPDDTLSFYAVVRVDAGSPEVVVLLVEVMPPAPSWSFFFDSGEWSKHIARCPNIADARRLISQLRAGLENIGRHPKDPANIFEIWI
jgi:hypothetical protein